MDFPFESPDMNATTIQKPLRYRKGFRSRRALIALNEHVGHFNKEQQCDRTKICQMPSSTKCSTC